MSKIFGQYGLFSLWKLAKKNKNSEFKPVKLRLKKWPTVLQAYAAASDHYKEFVFGKLKRTADWK